MTIYQNDSSDNVSKDTNQNYILCSVCNERMIEKDVMEGCLQRKDDREGCNGWMLVTEGCQRRMSRKEEVHSRHEKKEGGTLSQIKINAWINIYMK